MKKLIIILLVLISVNSFAQQVTTEKHYFIQGFSAGMITSSITSVVMYEVTKSKGVAVITGIVTSFATGILINEVRMHNGKEVGNREVINSMYGGLATVISFNIVIGKKKVKKQQYLSYDQN